MSIVWLVIYLGISVWFIRWVLIEVKKLDVGHGDHVHDGRHADPEPDATSDGSEAAES